MSRFKVGVCQGHPELGPGSSEWKGLCAAVEKERPDLMLLGELPFGPWISAAPGFDARVWSDSVAVHQEGVSRLGELGAPVVASSRPREVSGRRVNEAYVWSRDDGVTPVHTKQFFPDEEDYYEARWFEGGERHFRVATRRHVGAAERGCRRMGQCLARRGHACRHACRCKTEANIQPQAR